MLEIFELADTGDARGSSFGPPPDFFAERFPLGDLHLTTVLPGAVRGNHFHLERHELLTVLSTGPWSLHWDEGEGTAVHTRAFGPGAVLIRVPLRASHAVRNDGTTPLQVIGMTDGPFDPARPDAYPRDVV
ncbi:hypothetical protein Val02_18540 [Virgisporangium aliadipatigenens]|uniref:Capsular polysaccharide assembling protein CapF C-terminal domain-containing protein n=1 Tax=Virgisporangium aliadipatigenens TaxID=741659 RepID=A0A8J4DPS6_9ACTN|nr:hypothetical protein [Virgisporangium aliadipatigenens]GIJ44968.1 hypothetical protein Val02_18540 [Virgisporangium aliadipatigenens]